MSRISPARHRLKYAIRLLATSGLDLDIRRADSHRHMARARVFVSYRRDDSRHVAARIADHLRWVREIRTVFFDTGSVPPGSRFHARIDSALESATHTLVVIGPRWLAVEPGQQRPRIHEEHDLVRREVAHALRGGGEVIPILIDGAAMPEARELPDSLRDLANRNAYVVHGDRAFDDDLRPLLRHVIGHEPRGTDTWLGIAGKAIAGLVMGILVFLAFSAALQWVFGLTAETLFRPLDAEDALKLWSLLPFVFGLTGAVLASAPWRQWRRS